MWHIIHALLNVYLTEFKIFETHVLTSAVKNNALTQLIKLQD